jgi:hypothetical protein
LLSGNASDDPSSQWVQWRGGPLFCGLWDDEFLIHEFKNHLAEIAGYTDIGRSTRFLFPVNGITGKLAVLNAWRRGKLLKSDLPAGPQGSTSLDESIAISR